MPLLVFFRCVAIARMALGMPVDGNLTGIANAGEGLIHLLVFRHLLRDEAIESEKSLLANSKTNSIRSGIKNDSSLTLDVWNQQFGFV